jgi:hypothetical protein
LCDRGQYIRKSWVAVKKAGKDHVYALFWDISSNGMGCNVVGLHEIDPYHVGTKQFYVDTVGNTRTHLQWLKTWALEHGATPDAIRLLHEAIGLSKKEQEEMAKAATKTKSAGTKPVGKGGKLGSKSGGNPAALEKAREAAKAKNAANDALKITVTAKLADLKLRGGRKAKFEHISKNKPKTVGDVRGTEVKDDDGNTHVIDMGALRGMEKRGHIKLG